MQEFTQIHKAKRFKCKFQTSKWSISELVQTLMDRELVDILMLDGHEMSRFNRVRSQYPLPSCKRRVIDQADFEKFFATHGIEITEVPINPHKIHEYCMKYALETPDAVHVLCATQYSQYLVTIDKALIESKVKEVQIIDPGNLITKSELRFR